MGGCRLWSRAGNIGSRNGLARDLPSDRDRMCVVASELHRPAIGSKWGMQKGHCRQCMSSRPSRRGSLSTAAVPTSGEAASEAGQKKMV